MVEALRPWFGPEMTRSTAGRSGKRLYRPSWAQLAGVPFSMTTQSLFSGPGGVWSQVPSAWKASGWTECAVREASMRWALPIHEREAAGMATETRWPAVWSSSTSGRM